MSFLLTSAARATVGARSGQEDCFRLWPSEGVVRPLPEQGGLLAVLADGMGGHTGGAIAGQTACTTFAEAFAASAAPYDERLQSALQESNEALARAVAKNAALRGMGCTLLAVWIDVSGMRWTSVGDSLLLLYRYPEVIRLNADHSLGALLDEQARQNIITPDEAKAHLNRHALRSALTGATIELIDTRSEPLKVRAGDWIVLASDGICSLAGDEMATVMGRDRHATAEAMAEGLIEAVLAKRVAGQDNATVVVVRIADERSVPFDELITRAVVRPAESGSRRAGASNAGRLKGAATGRGARRPPLDFMPNVRAAVWLGAAAGLLVAAVAIVLWLRPANVARPAPSSVPDRSSLRVLEARPPDADLLLAPQRPPSLPHAQSENEAPARAPSPASPREAQDKMANPERNHRGTTN